MKAFICIYYWRLLRNLFFALRPLDQNALRTFCFAQSGLQEEIISCGCMPAALLPPFSALQL